MSTRVKDAGGVFAFLSSLLLLYFLLALFALPGHLSSLSFASKKMPSIVTKKNGRRGHLTIDQPFPLPPDTFFPSSVPISSFVGAYAISYSIARDPPFTPFPPRKVLLDPFPLLPLLSCSIMNRGLTTRWEEEKGVART